MQSLTRRVFLASPAALALAQNSSQEQTADRRLLAGGYSADKIGNLLLPRQDWSPYPRLADRAYWLYLPGEVKQSFLNAASRELGKPMESLPASVMLDFQRNGNRTRYEDISFGRRTRLRRAVIAECIENQGRFLDDILNALWLICEESFWGVSAHVNAQKAGTGLPDVTEPIVDLFAAETGNTVAWIDYLMPEQLQSLSKLLRPRLKLEVKRRILDPLLTRSDFGWQGLNHRSRVNNWNPWINSNWLACNLLMEDDRQRRAQAAYKALTSIDRFLDSYYPDGGCDEGPSYWGRAGASLFDCLEIVHSASNGKLNFFSIPLVKEIGAYIYRAHIADDWYTNFADASARVHPNANLVWRYGQRIMDEKMIAHGAWLASRETHTDTRADAMGRLLDELRYCGERKKTASGSLPPLVRDVFLPGTQYFTARIQAGSTQGFYVAAQGGHNAESHNHNDVGNFIVFHDGQPVLIDVGVETYTAKTFSSRRYEIWTMQSQWHNCPTINGVAQSAGRRFEAHDFHSTSNDSEAKLAMDIERAYPADAGVRGWHREIVLNRKAGRVNVTDSFQLTKTQSLDLNLITIQTPRQSGPGKITLSGGFQLSFDPALQVTLDEHSSDDARLKPNWGPTVRRIRLSTQTPPAQGAYTLTLEKL
jgi:hypothetical protein